MALFESEALRGCSLNREKVQEMGSIVSFRPRPATDKVLASNPDMPGQIIMFTGVRYERTVTAEAPMNWTSAGWMAPFQPNPIPQR